MCLLLMRITDLVEIVNTAGLICFVDARRAQGMCSVKLQLIFFHIIIGLETELLTDYYLIPGAEWSLLKKGDTVKVLGKAGADGCWYRCMALQDTDIKIPDLSLPPPSIVNALLPGTIIGQEKGMTSSTAAGAAVLSHGGLGSQLQQDVVMEDPLNEAMEAEEMEGEEETGE